MGVAVQPTPQAASVYMPILDIELGWLAGTIDGEGFVGLDRSAGIMSPVVQVHTTHQPTANRIEELFILVGATKVGRYVIDRPLTRAHHKRVYAVRCRRLADVHAVVSALAPHAVTKREQCRLVREFCELRLGLAVTNEDGRSYQRGKFGAQPYGEREHAIYDELREVNRKGPR